MPVKISQFNAELIELRDMAQQPAESLRLVWFSGLAESARQKLSALVHELKLPLRKDAPMGGVLDFDKDNAQYGALSGWLLAGAATQMVELGQGTQWILCNDNNQTWAMVVGNQAPVLQTPAEDLPDVQTQGGKVTTRSTDDTHIASGKKITITAQDELVLICGGGYIKLKGGNVEIGGPGKLLIKNTGITKAGSASMQGVMRSFEPESFKEKFVVTHPLSGKPIPGQRYKVTLPDGGVIEGVTDAAGKTQLLNSQAVDDLKIMLLND